MQFLQDVYKQGDFHLRNPLHSTISLSKPSSPFFWIPPHTCKNTVSFSLSIGLWCTLKRIQNSEGKLNWITFIYFSNCDSFLKIVSVSFGRRVVLSSFRMNISMLFALQFGNVQFGNEGKRRWEKNKIKYRSLHSHCTL